MASLRTIYDGHEGQVFRAIVRPSLYGRIGAVEPIMAARMRDALEVWLRFVISETIAVTKLNDNKGEIYKQLMRGAKVTGGYSLKVLRGRIDVYPWLVAHEFGAHITPKTTKYLAIPMFYALRPDGSPKFRSPQAWDRFGAFVYTQKSTGKKFLAYKGANGELRILYLLVDHVDIPARLGLNKMADRNLGALLSAWGAIYVEEAFRAGITELWGAVA